MDLNSLPNEIIYMIMTHISPMNRRGISRVSKIWQFLIRCLDKYPNISLLNENKIQRISWNTMTIEDFIVFDSNLYNGCAYQVKHFLYINSNKIALHVFVTHYIESQIICNRRIDIMDIDTKVIHNIYCEVQHFSNYAESIGFIDSSMFDIFALSKDKTRFYLSKGISDYNLKPNIIIFDSKTMDMIENVEVTFQVNPIYNVTEMSSVDKFIFKKDASSDPIYCLDILSGKLFNIIIDIYDIENIKNYGLTSDETKMFIIINNRFFIISLYNMNDISTPVISDKGVKYYKYKPNNIIEYHVNMINSHFYFCNLSNDKLYLFFVPLNDKHYIYDISKKKFVLLKENHYIYDISKKTETILPSINTKHYWTHFIKNMEFHVKSVIDEIEELKFKNSLILSDMFIKWIYLVHLPNAIWVYPYVITYKYNHLIVIDMRNPGPEIIGVFDICLHTNITYFEYL